MDSPMKQVKATIDGEGNVSLDWSGFKGSACLTESKRLHELLQQYGIKKTAETEFTAKPELEQAQAIEQAQRQQEAQTDGRA